MQNKLIKIYLRLHHLLEDQRAELDEKALLITFFVLIAMVGLTALGGAVSGQFDNLAGLV